MSSIDKISIRGIRAFSPDQENVIEFYSPLTMIVGSNGCGKTTIIECLKYVCCGVLPPNSSKGHVFVNDPQMSGRSEVKASIKMKFRNRTSHPMVCQRNFSLTQKKKKVEFRALDGAIKTKNAEGDTITTSHKCTDLDNQIPLLLGVSKAVLENVIFCHQEDSSWPLQEPKDLKTRFDDIFESTRYTKALDAIKKKKKELTERVKDSKITLAELQGNLNAARGLRRDIDEGGEKIDEKTLDLNRLTDEVQSLSDKISLREPQIARAKRLEKDLEQVMWEKSALEENIDSLAKLISEELSDDDETLRHALDKFDQQLLNARDRLRQLEADQSQKQEELASLRNKQNSEQENKGILAEKLNQLHKLQQNRSELLQQLSTKYDMALLLAPDEMSTEHEAANAILSMQEKVKQLDRRASALKNDNIKRLKDLNEELRSADNNVVRLLALRTQKDTTIDEIRREKSKISTELSQIGHLHQSDVDDAVSALQRIELEIESATKLGTVDALERELGDVQGQLSNLKTCLEVDESARRVLQENRQALDKIQYDERQLKLTRMRLENELTELRSQYEEYLDGKSVEPDCDTISQTMNWLGENIQSKERELKRESKKLEDNQTEHTTKTALINHMLAERNRKQPEAQTRAAKVNSLKSVLTELRNEVRSNTFTLDNLSGAEEVAKRLLDSAEADLKNHTNKADFYEYEVKRTERNKQQFNEYKCPCCLKTMTDHEFAGMKERAARMRDDKEATLQEVQQQFDRKKTLHESVQALISAVALHITLEREMQSDDVQIRQLEAEQDEAKKSVKGNKHRVEELRKRIETLKNLFNRLEAKKQALIECKSAEDNIEDKKSRSESLSIGLSDARSLNEVETSLEDGRRKQDELLHRKDKLNKEIQTIKDRMMNLQTQKSQKMIDLNEARKAATRYQELTQRKRDMEEKEKALKQEKATASEELDSFQSQHLECQKRRDGFAAEAESKERNCTEKLGEVEKDLQYLAKAHDEVKDMEDMKLDQKVKKSDQRIRTLSHQILETEQNMRVVEEQMSTIKSNCANSDTGKRLLRDNLELREKRRLLRKKDEESTELRSRVEETECETAMREVVRAKSDMARKLEERARVEGQLAEMTARVNSLKQRLKADEFRKIDQKYRKKQIEVETLTYAVSDLDIFWTALDKAVSKYHSIKLQTINKIIQELWQYTYTGEDIDSIMIKSGEEGEASRSYNYRVVMTKGGLELDMRGRCSAGQRVLASLVIRLALAETFCLNCGIMALDEPTTNLDERNKAALAQALARIIHQRAKQHNFQLVCITHEMEFVTLMKRHLSVLAGFPAPEYYWLVSREKQDDEGTLSKYFSKVTRNNWSDM